MPTHCTNCGTLLSERCGDFDDYCPDCYDDNWPPEHWGREDS